jgi:HAD superfamily hydrolase (TIGR01490 family)
MAPGRKKPFAVFDIDGTLIRWQLYHAVVDKLAENGHIKANAFDKVKTARMVWKIRTKDTSFYDYEYEIVVAYEEAILNISVNNLMEAVKETFDEYKDQTYTYTRDLIRSLKKKGYLLFAISGSQTEIIKLLAEYYGFDDFGGTIYKSKAGRFTGEKDVMKRERKPAYLKDLVKKHNSTFEGSIGVGDSDGDILMLETVENPIAFNPNKLLFEHAKANNWQVVIERKNMIYKLEPKDGTFILA